jgi:hypothetical protein
LDHASRETVPAVHHFFKDFLFTWLRVGLVLFTYYILSRIISKGEEICLGVKTIVRDRLVRVAGRVLEWLLWHNIKAGRHATLALHDWGLTPLVICLVGVIVVQEVHMLRELTLCSLSVPDLFCVVTTVLHVF